MAAKLALDWSPQQISGWLARTYPGEQALQVSSETIYRSLFVQARGVLRKELLAHLRTRRSIRRSRLATTKGQGRGGIVDAVSIRERPAEAEDRAVPGHWEGDLLAGSANSHIATLVERQTRYLLLVKVPGKGSTGVVDALAAQVQTLPRQLWASLTWDRGVELADHRRFSIATDVAVYFCDPRSPWQRGTNENTNGLLRQYFPKWTEPVRLQPGRSRRRRRQTQHQAPQDARIPDPGRYAGCHRCVDPLNPPPTLSNAFSLPYGRNGRPEGRPGAASAVVRSCPGPIWLRTQRYRRATAGGSCRGSARSHEGGIYRPRLGQAWADRLQCEDEAAE